MHLVFPEGDDTRVQKAATMLLEQGVRVTLLADAHPSTLTEEVSVISPAELAADPEIVAAYCAGPRAPTAEVATERLHKSAYAAAAMLAAGRVDAALGGAVLSSAEVIGAGLHVLGTASGIRRISSYFVMTDLQGRQRLLADCAVNIEPDAAQLAEIAALSADNAAALLGRVPRVALLSFSTHGSAAHEAAEKVAQATQLLRERGGDWLVEGEIQADAALDAQVASRKQRADSAFFGDADVLIFPNLSAGNIAYKLLQQCAGWQAAGPILQGLSRPYGDLSRGADAVEIARTANLLLAQVPKK